MPRRNLYVVDDEGVAARWNDDDARRIYDVDDDDVDLGEDPAVELQHRNAAAWSRQQAAEARFVMMSCHHVVIRPEDLLRFAAALATRRLRWWFDAFLFGALRSKGDRVVARAKTERMRWWLERLRRMR